MLPRIELPCLRATYELPRMLNGASTPDPTRARGVATHNAWHMLPRMELPHVLFGVKLQSIQDTTHGVSAHAAMRGASNHDSTYPANAFDPLLLDHLL
jgi:hypothetical protein